MTADYTIPPKQPNRAGPTAAAIAAAVALVTGSVMLSEGKRNVTYLDIIGTPTDCYGETFNVGKVGTWHSDADCKTQLATSLTKHATAMAKCIHVQVPPPSLQAFISLDYNIGEGAFCKSSIARKLNAGDLRGACNGLMAWSYAGGRYVQGLANRRAKEQALCLKGVAQ